MTAWKKRCGAIAAGLLLGLAAQASKDKSADQKTPAVDEVFEDLTRAGSPGCALGVYRDGKMLYEKGYGLANIEENVVITPETIFDIGSTSKQFTATSILLLEKQGKLSVNDDIHKYVPELPDYGAKITILQLLNHTSGLRDYLALMELAGTHIDSVTTDEDALQLIVRQKALNFAPGSEYLYSNTGFFLLSVIVKRVSGKTLREFAADNIFQALEMSHTLYRDDHTELLPNRALAYDEKEKKDGYKMNVSYFEQTGDGAVHTSVQDLLKWDENFYNSRVGGRELVGKLQERAKLNNGKTLDYARGLAVADYRGLRSVSHGGAWGGYRAELLRFPEQHFSVACLCNLGNANPSKRARQVADIYLANMMKAKETKKLEEDEEKEAETPVHMSAEELKGYAGDYWSPELAVVYRLEVKEEGLKVTTMADESGLTRSNDLTPRELKPVGKNKFRFGGEEAGYITVTFKKDGEKEAAGFTLNAGRTTGMEFTRAKGRRTEPGS